MVVNIESICDYDRTSPICCQPICCHPLSVSTKRENHAIDISILCIINKKNKFCHRFQ